MQLTIESDENTAPGGKEPHGRAWHQLVASVEVLLRQQQDPLKIVEVGYPSTDFLFTVWRMRCARGSQCSRSR